MSIAADKARIEEAKAAIAAAIAEKGVDVPEGTKIDGMAELIAAIEAGGGGIETGSFCLAEFRVLYQNQYTISHSLGVIPSYVFVWYEDLFSIAAGRTPHQLYSLSCSPTRCLCLYQYSGTSYLNTSSESIDFDWLKNPSTYGAPRINIGSVTETSFSIGSPLLQPGLAPVNYRWVVVA
ncbi:MAG: hypothetical protein ACOX81_02180 [Candidatus Heteroscillospira sp.]|jgi:hypothetical protein